jgi:hypothetical protein
MLEQERQNKLNLNLEKLRKLPGVSDVVSDDWDSRSVNVFISLHGNPKEILKNPSLRTIKNSIKRTCSCLIVDQPNMQYEEMSGTKYKLGYDKMHIKIHLFI